MVVTAVTGWPSPLMVEFQRVAVLGAGTMGAGIAQVSAQAGASVALFDIQQDFVDHWQQDARMRLRHMVRTACLVLP